MRTLMIAATALVLFGCASAPGTLHTFTSDAAGFDTHSMYYDTGAEVVVFDAQFTGDHAKALLADIRRTTSNPITHVVVTHPNPDKFNGAAVFQAEGAKVVASKATTDAIPGVHAYKKYYFVEIAKSFTNETYPAEASVDQTFEGTLTLELDGGKTITLKVLENPGVSSTQTVAHIPEVGALIVGDLVHHEAHAWLEGGIVEGAPKPDLARWRAALEELRAFGEVTVYGGRGASAPVDEAVNAQSAYLERVDALVKQAREAKGAPLTQDDHAALSASIIGAFPNRALPYMVEYSIYGLAGVY